jgi:hypothetical protein
MSAKRRLDTISEHPATTNAKRRLDTISEHPVTTNAKRRLGTVSEHPDTMSAKRRLETISEHPATTLAPSNIIGSPFRLTNRGKIPRKTLVEASRDPKTVWSLPRRDIVVFDAIAAQ